MRCDVEALRMPFVHHSLLEEIGPDTLETEKLSIEKYDKWSGEGLTYIFVFVHNS